MMIAKMVAAIRAYVLDLELDRVLRDDREAGADREAAPLSDREAFRTYERAGLNLFA